MLPELLAAASSSGGTPVWVVVLVAALGIIPGVGAILYQRRSAREKNDVDEGLVGVRFAQQAFDGLRAEVEALRREREQWQVEREKWAQERERWHADRLKLLTRIEALNFQVVKLRQALEAAGMQVPDLKIDMG